MKTDLDITNWKEGKCNRGPGAVGCRRCDEPRSCDRAHRLESRCDWLDCTWRCDADDRSHHRGLTPLGLGVLHVVAQPCKIQTGLAEQIRLVRGNPKTRDVQESQLTGRRRFASVIGALSCVSTIGEKAIVVT